MNTPIRATQGSRARRRGHHLLVAACLCLTLAWGPGPARGQDGTVPADPDGAPAEPGAEDAGPVFWSPSEAAEPRGLRVREAGAYEGYTIIQPLNSTDIHLVDMDGEVVHTWRCGSAPGAWCYLRDDGLLLRAGRHDDEPHFAGGGIGGLLELVAPDGSLHWSWTFADDENQQHHDLEPLPNGNVLLIAWEEVGATAAVRSGRDLAQVSREKGFWPDTVLEVRPVPPDGVEFVWQWRAWDHLVQDHEPRYANFGVVAEHPGRLDLNADHRYREPLTEEEQVEEDELVAAMGALGYTGGVEDEPEEEAGDDPAPEPSGDWLHTNAVDYDAEHDLIVLSSPHLSEIFIIDHSTDVDEARVDTGGRRGHGGELLWRWGNPRNHGAGEASDQRLFYQHDPTFVRGDDGSLRLLVFNNGRGREDGDYSSVMELELPFDPEAGFRRDGAAWGPAEPTWEYSAGDDFYSAFISGAQRLPNGNTLICSGAPGRVFEVTRDGRLVWDYRNELGGDVEPPEHAGKAPPLALFRATRLAPDHPGVQRVLEFARR